MKRLVMLFVTAVAAAPFALAACTWSWVPGIYSGCGNTVDCWESFCYRGSVESSTYFCQVQGSLCCECYTVTRNCIKWNGTACGGYYYDAIKNSYTQAVCGAIAPGGSPNGSRCFQVPQ